MQAGKNIAPLGFTLVELLIVVGIMGLLATIGISAYSSARTNSRNQQRKANLTQLAKALEFYANDHGGQYPATPAGEAWGACTVYGGGTRPHADSGATGWIPNLAPAYISTLPRDPITNQANPNSTDSTCRTTAGYACYVYRSDGIKYKLFANCLPEGTVAASDPFYDPVRTWNYQVSTGDAATVW